MNPPLGLLTTGSLRPLWTVLWTPMWINYMGVIRTYPDSPAATSAPFQPFTDQPSGRLQIRPRSLVYSSLGLLGRLTRGAGTNLAAHGLELLLGGHLLSEEHGLHALDQSFEPTDKLGLRYL